MQDRLRLVILFVGFTIFINVDVATVELRGFVGCPKPRMDTVLC